MKYHGLLSVLSTLFLFTVFSAAWPGPDRLGDKIANALIPRQNTGASSSASATASASASQSNGNSASASNSASGSGTITGSASKSTATGSGSKNSTKTTAIDPRLPPGGIQMMTPAATAAMTFVKVGDQVTFGWNYTSLSVPPSYIDIVATNTINSQSYTIAANQSWQSTQSVVWDTGDYAATNSIPFVVATYTLMVYDANSEPTAVASAGYLGAFANFQFGVYTPQPYVPLNEFRCATCSGAMSIHEKQALSVLLGTCAVTILSFTWFASGFGII